ncbi:hypothetical protein BJY00DRAFT_101069 [Aspergillus carlsbadensis]|nr:hypothetical protein BJY00DRAFT_101069 [Aspergillus carlsbadensis]
MSRQVATYGWWFPFASRSCSVSLGATGELVARVGCLSLPQSNSRMAERPGASLMDRYGEILGDSTESTRTHKLRDAQRGSNFLDAPLFGSSLKACSELFLCCVTLVLSLEPIMASWTPGYRTQISSPEHSIHGGRFMICVGLAGKHGCSQALLV